MESFQVTANTVLLLDTETVWRCDKLLETVESVDRYDITLAFLGPPARVCQASTIMGPPIPVQVGDFSKGVHQQSGLTVSSLEYRSGLQTFGPIPHNYENLERIASRSLELFGPLPTALHPPPELASSSLQQLFIPLLQYNGVQRLLQANITVFLKRSPKYKASTLWPTPFNKPQYLPELHLYFGGRVYRDAVRAQLMWNYPSEEAKSSYSSFKSVSTRPAESFNISTQSSPNYSPSNLPMICYIGKTQLTSVRNNLFRVASGPGRTWNEPVFRLQQLRARILVPSNSDHDAHFVGVFLGMAQKHFYTTPPVSSRRDSPISPGQSIPPSPHFHDIKLKILTHDIDTSEFIVYTGNITKAVLEKFHDPFKAPADDDDTIVSGLKIEYTRVPIWPILGLRERLGKALGQEIVGTFNPDEIEAWEKDPEKRPSGEKRKRDVLTEVVNSSYEEETEEEPAIVSKKGCLNQDTPVGVTI
ncbi:hypothetical protein FOMA001_g18233 [Fusarium oxysporum f. sp. matthiolae]|nr:hypothetical protein FOMA001_g18233 [Fusarium oxysporum f. sp. matthiolae]